jgi:hypothetical protein
MPTPAPTSLTLGERQLALYLNERGVDPKSIPPAAMKEIIEMALESMELTSLRDSQAMVRYMGLLKAYSQVIADYCTKFGQVRNREEQVVCDILSTHGVRSAAD